MKTTILIASLLCGMMTTAVQAQTAQSDVSYTRGFTLDSVDARVAESWFWELCGELAKGVACRVREVVSGNPRMLQVDAPNVVHAAFARRLAERDVGRVSHSLQLLLVEASKDGSGIDKSIPAEATKALQDVREFLPFSGFRLLDSGWMTSSGRGQLQLSGKDGRVYLAGIAFSQELRLEGTVLAVSPLSIRSIPTNDATPEGDPRYREVMSSNLTLSVGETVVVGTSRLNGGDRALIVLLTARD